MATLYIENTPTDPSDLSAFAFHIPHKDEAHPQPADSALLRVDFKEKPSVLVKGPEAVTLKVLLSSLGIRDLSKEWELVPDTA